jgi:outer membrane lipoprotein SlyB
LLNSGFSGKMMRSHFNDLAFGLKSGIIIAQKGDTRMKKLTLVIFCLSIFSLNLGCQNTKTRATEGAIIGGVVGAAAGGIIGHQSGHGGEGAGIGAAVGALSGGIIGAQIEKPGANQQAAAPAQGAAANPSQMTQQQIIDLSKQGVNENVIIDKIRLTNSKFTLTAQDIANLKSQGVSSKVIDAMQGN